MPFGLTSQQIKVIHTVLAAYPEIEEALIFGSRALNVFQEASDVDLALKGNITFDLVAKVKSRLDESSIPYFFDVVDYHTIQNPDFKSYIDQYGVLFYKK